MLVERHATEIYRLAAAIVGETDARDLTQDTFAGAWTDLPWLRAGADVREPVARSARAALALHYSMGLSIAQSAEALGIRVGTAKSRLHAGLETLRRAIAPRADPGPADAPTELLS